jgi:hypothetical protein
VGNHPRAGPVPGNPLPEIDAAPGEPGISQIYETKSALNLDKQGIDFVETQALCLDPYLPEIRAKNRE